MTNGLGSGIPRSEVIVNDVSLAPPSSTRGMTAVYGITERGPIGESVVISSWGQYLRTFGGLLSDSLFPFYCKRALERGSSIRVGRVLHFADASDLASFTAVAASANITNATNNALITAVSPGTWGNAISIAIVAAASGNTDNVDITVTLSGYPQLAQTLRDVTAAIGDTEKSIVNQKLRLVNIGAVANALPIVEGTLTNGADDNGSVVDADYIGNPAGTGKHMFDNASDFVRVCAPEIADAGAVETDLVNYCISRGDCIAMLRTPSGIDGLEAVDYRNRVGAYAGSPAIDTFYALMFYGDIPVVDPLTDLQRDIHVIGDVIGAYGAKDTSSFPWFAAAGRERGRLYDNLGVVYDVGVPARREEADKLTLAGINYVINHPTFGTVLWGSSSLQREDTKLKNANIAELIIDLVRNLGPRMDLSLFEPNDITTWKEIYLRVTSFMESVKTDRGVTDYVYEGDQDIDFIEDAVFNDLDEVDNGVYRFRLHIKPINSLKYIGLEVSVSSTSVDFNVINE